MIYQQVENGLIDVGIGYLIERNPNLSTSVLYYDSFELVVSPTHPLASQPHATIEALRKFRLFCSLPIRWDENSWTMYLKSTKSYLM